MFKSVALSIYVALLGITFGASLEAEGADIPAASDPLGQGLNIIGGTSGPESPQSAASPKLQAGLFQVRGDNGKSPRVVLEANGSGYYNFDGTHVDFSWRLEDGSMFITALDPAIAENDREVRASIQNPSVFIIGNKTYTRNKTVAIDTYQYAEDGFSGALTLYDWDPNDDNIYVEISTVNDEAEHTCDFEATCQARGDKVVCRGDKDDPDSVLIVDNVGNDTVNVAGALSTGAACGSRGSLMGKYRLLK